MVFATGIVADFEHHVVVAVGGKGTGADIGGVVDGRRGVGRAVLRRGATVVLTGAIARFGILDHEPELAFAAEAFVVVKGVVTVESRNQILGVDRAAEPLKAVVLVVVHLDVFDDCAAADAAHGQAVDFIARADVGAAVADGRVAEDAGVVAVVVAAVEAARLGGGNALNGGFARLGIEASPAEDDDAAPKAASVEWQVVGIADVVGLGGEDDWLVRGAFGENFAAASDDEGTGVFALSRFALDDRARLNRQRGALTDKN